MLRLRFGPALTAPNAAMADAGADIITALERQAADVLARIEAATNLGRAAGRPFVVEFAGSPRAGKSTLLRGLERFLKRNGYSVAVVDEPLVDCGVGDKRDLACNVWTICRTLERVLELPDSARHVVLFDRGLFDRLCWLNWYRRTGQLSDQEYRVISEFIRLPRWRQMVDVVFVLTARPAVAIERELAHQVTRRTGQIVNETTLLELNEAIKSMARAARPVMNRIHLDTSDHDEQQTLRWISITVLRGLARFVDHGIADGIAEDTRRELIELKSRSISPADSSAAPASATSQPSRRRRPGDPARLVASRRTGDTCQGHVTTVRSRTPVAST